MSQRRLHGEVFLRTEGLTKSFPGVVALREVTLEVRAGEVHAVVGENGAGKSTLMRILAGLMEPDAGRIWIEGQPVRIRTPHEATVRGIAMIHQELMPFPDLTVAENLFMGREPRGRLPGSMDRRRMEREARERSRRLGVELDPRRRMGELTVAEMQAVEIARAFVGEARLLIMDEPTSAISDREADALFRLIGELKTRGVAVLYISHRLEEIFRIADRVTVLRDGNWVATLARSELGPRGEDQLIALMVGREIGAVFPRIDRCGGEALLEVVDLGRAGAFAGVNLQVRCGEVLGLAGLMGAGRSEVLRALYGLTPATSGMIRVRGRTVRIRRPQDALRCGIALVTEDRQRDGLVPTMTLRENLTLASLRRWCRFGWVDRRAERAEALERIRALAVRALGAEHPVRLLSGGNQQKVILGRALLTEPEVLLLDEPTRGIDVGAKAEVYRLIADLARQGKGIILVSSELSEVMALSHRLLVMCDGAIAAELDPRHATPDAVLRHAMPSPDVSRSPCTSGTTGF